MLGDGLPDRFAQLDDHRVDEMEQVAVGLGAAAHRLLERLARVVWSVRKVSASWSSGGSRSAMS